MSRLTMSLIALFFIIICGSAAILIKTTTLGNQAAALYQSLNTDVTITQCAIAQEVESSSYTSSRLHLTQEGKAILLELRGDAYCGTAGCQFRICEIANDNEVTMIPFGYAGTKLTLGQTYSNTKRDLVLSTAEADIMLRWDGQQYLPEQSF